MSLGTPSLMIRVSEYKRVRDLLADGKRANGRCRGKVPKRLTIQRLPAKLAHGILRHQPNAGGIAESADRLPENVRTEYASRRDKPMQQIRVG